MSTKVITHEQLILDGKYRTGVFTLKANAGNLAAGTILKKTATYTAEVKAGENAGDGVLTLDATPTGEGVQVGDYVFACTAAKDGSTPAVFSYTKPDNTTGTPVNVGAGITGELNFKITEGTEGDFEVGDKFTVTVTETMLGLLEKWAGAGDPYALLMDGADNDAKNEQHVTVFLEGTFNAELIENADEAFDKLRALGIYLVHPADAKKYPAND